MKTIPYIIIGLLIALVLYLFLKPKPICVPIVIPQIEYRDSPEVDSLKNVIDTLQKNLIAKKQIFYKYIPVYRDTGSYKIVHDSILLLADDVFNVYDSLIAKKDSVIGYLTNELRLAKDTACYFEQCYIDEKSKTKRWKRVSIASIILNGLLILKI